MCGLIKPKSITWDQMEGSGCEKKVGEELSNRLVKRTLKFEGGFLMMWRCILWEGVRYSCKIDRRMDAELYTQILENEL